MAGRPIGEEGFAWLDPLIKAALDSVDELTPFQADFASSMADRLGRYGRNTYITAKQWDVAAGIATTLGLPEPDEARDAGAA